MKNVPMKGAQPILTGYLGAVLAILGPLFIASRIEVSNANDFRQAMLAWLACLGIFLVLIDRWVQARWGTLAPTTGAPPLSLTQVLPRALVRWLAWLALILLGKLALHTLHGYRSDWYAAFRTSFDLLIVFWLVGGLPYYLWVLRNYSGIRWDRRDVAVLLFSLLRKIYRVKIRKTHRWGRAPVLWNGKKAIRVWLGLGVKAFFIPIMTTFFLSNARECANLLNAFRADLLLPTAWTDQFYMTSSHLYHLSFSSLMLIDVTLALLGYLITMRVLDNGIKSTEPTALGWAVCLACYPPVSDLASWYFRLPGRQIDNLPNNEFKIICMALIIALLVIYVWATTAFGLRFSNLTNRGILTQGPYRHVRHPAYISKNLSWWLQYCAAFPTQPLAIVYLLGWNAIYVARAWTEERHLSEDPQYREYKKQVRWRFIPGLY